MRQSFYQVVANCSSDAAISSTAITSVLNSKSVKAGYFQNSGQTDGINGSLST
ncbi:hypothetical protein [Chryseobacterium phocaeense]|uniref:hypothetical protein n=1 Tax=Chryseobacterium phocaeense TaxID=1816690 RepID=UPI0013EF1207|nr:hypothetical protein [Chryseobacterium phocaeense]